MKSMKVMKKKAAMKRRAMKAVGAPTMKAMKSMKAMKAVKSIPKSGIADALAASSGVGKTEVMKLLDDFADLATKEVKKTGKFTIPGLCMIKTRKKPATKACMRNVFGEMKKIAAKPAKTVVKAFVNKALKDQI